MILTNPVWLLLLVPLLIGFGAFRSRVAGVNFLRTVLLVLVILGLCGLTVKLPIRRGTVVVIADRSSSMPVGSSDRQEEIISLLQSEMGSGNQLAVISFGREAHIEHAAQQGKFSNFVAETQPDGSNLAEAIDNALATVPAKSPARLIVLSDGRWSGADPVHRATVASQRDIAIDYRLMQRALHNDLAIQKIDAPSRVAPGESFMVNAWLKSPVQGGIQYRLMRGSTTVAAGARSVPSGLSRLMFRDMASRTGTMQYKLEVTSETEDNVPENNSARFLVAASGRKPLLLVNDSGDSDFGGLLRGSGFDVVSKTPAQCRWSLADLTNYAAVIFQNVPARNVGASAMENLAAWVRTTPSGFMMTGGKDSFGPGGYFRSPLEEVMPVSMELRKEHRKLALAITVVLDRSGSMAAQATAGKTKMDLANAAAVQVLDMLTAMDEFGVIAVDSSAHNILPLTAADKAKGHSGRILRINAQGGGIFVYNGLIAAASMLAEAKPQNRHIILFADAADSEQPGKYRELLKECEKANITVSVVGLGTAGDVDAAFLRDVAKRGNGRCFFTRNAQQLPRLFAQDTLIVARSSFLEEPVKVKTTPGLLAVTSKPFDIDHPIGGYNLCYLREGANLGVYTLDEYEAPLVASSQPGLGRVLCYTGQIDGEYTGPIASWPEVSEFFASLTNWVAGTTEQLGGDMMLTQNVKEGAAEIQLHLDPDRKTSAIEQPPEVIILSDSAASQPAWQSRQMKYVDPDTLELTVPLAGTRTYVSTVRIGQGRDVSLPPVCLPYSPEYRPVRPDRGRQTLQSIAQLTGGKERINLAGVWDDLPKMPRNIELAPWLFLAAAAVFLLEVLQRRTGVLPALVSAIGARRLKALFKFQRHPVRRRKSPKPRTMKTPRQPVAAKEQNAAEREHQAESAERGQMLSAMSKARKKAKQRTDRKRND